MTEPIDTVYCGICSKGVFLTDCKIDEDGHAVHEECYARRVKVEPVKEGDGKDQNEP